MTKWYACTDCTGATFFTGRRKSHLRYAALSVLRKEAVLPLSGSLAILVREFLPVLTEHQ